MKFRTCKIVNDYEINDYVHCKLHYIMKDIAMTFWNMFFNPI